MKAILFIASFFIFSSSGPTGEYRAEVYYAYVNNKMERWKSVIDRFEVVKEKTNEMTLELLNYQYGYIGYCLEFNKEDDKSCPCDSRDDSGRRYQQAVGTQSHNGLKVYFGVGCQFIGSIDRSKDGGYQILGDKIDREYRQPKTYGRPRFPYPLLFFRSLYLGGQIFRLQ